MKKRKIRGTKKVSTIPSATLKSLRELARERNMISDLIMSDNSGWPSPVFEAHDAHSFWSAVREAHKQLKSNDKR